jgi:hypothetical protein
MIPPTFGGKNMPVTVQRMTMMPGDRPERVEVVIADAPTRQDATVWIKARLAFSARPDEKIALVAQALLEQIENIVDEAKRAAKAPA